MKKNTYYFTLSQAYRGNTAINIYDDKHTLVDCYIVSDYDISGYTQCLCDFGYENKGWVASEEELDIY